MSGRAIGDVLIDVILSEEHTYDSDVTSHPVETGASITDNVVDKPLIISLDCIISATPFGATQPLGGSLFAVSIADVAQDRLIALKATREPVTVEDSQGSFPNMIVEKLTFTRSAKTGRACAFKCTLKELRLVDNERVLIPVEIPRAQALVKRGAKSSKSPPDPPITKKIEDNRDPAKKVVTVLQSLFE